jgi:holin-like protein
MIRGIGLLLGFQLTGEVIARLLHIPLPGSIIGLLLLFAWLRLLAFLNPANAEAIESTEVAQVATPLLRNLAILFVAPGVGVIQHLELFWQHGPTLALVLVASTLATMAAAALTFAATQSLAGRLRVARSKGARPRECSSSNLCRPVEAPVAPLDRRNG